MPANEMSARALLAHAQPGLFMNSRRESVESAGDSGSSDWRATKPYSNSMSRSPQGEDPEDSVLSALVVANS
jgi:hypothetical protein